MLYSCRAFVCAAVLFSLPVTRAFAVDSATTLFREEIVAALERIGWKGAVLPDDTRFAIAATGLSWMPEAGGVALIHKENKRARYADAEQRFAAFARLRSNGDKRDAFAFALSLLIDPPVSDAGWVAANQYLAPYGDDVDHALAGVLQAPEKMPLLPAYQYAAMDSLTRRASSRMLPLFLSLSESSDRYLRSRAVAALGLVAYQPGPERDVVPGLLASPRENPISAVQSRLIAEAVRDAASDKNWRVRAAAALALGLMRAEDDLPLLEKLSRDRAYLGRGSKADRVVVFPVRAQAAAALARFGKDTQQPVRATGRDADEVARGGQDVTKDQSDIRRDQTSRVRFAEGEW
jgi:HEAT repeat protein